MRSVGVVFGLVLSVGFGGGVSAGSIPERPVTYGVPFVEGVEDPVVDVSVPDVPGGVAVGVSAASGLSSLTPASFEGLRDAGVEAASAVLGLVEGASSRVGDGPVMVEVVALGVGQLNSSGNSNENANVGGGGGNGNGNGGNGNGNGGGDGSNAGGNGNGNGGGGGRRLLVDVLDGVVASGLGLERVGLRVEADGFEFVSGTRLRVTVDYSSFRDAFGGDWATRIRPAVFVECVVGVLVPSCVRPVVLDDFVNDYVAEELVFEVDVAGVMAAAGVVDGVVGFGLTASGRSRTGNFEVSSLNPSSLWSVGKQAGNFEWSLPFGVEVPEAGRAPGAGVSYSSQAIDGLTSDQNTQGGLLGPGWSVGDVFIERRFRSCSSISSASTDDLCHVDVNATVSIPGLIAGELVFDVLDRVSGEYTVDQYRVAGASGWLLKHFYRTSGEARGDVGVDNDGEYYQVISPDGVSYYFGYGARSGNFAPSTELGSVWTVPVRGISDGDPCFTLSNKWCHQAYRWNLDRVVTPDGYSTIYQYQPDVNHYWGLNGVEAMLPYHHGGRLLEVEYGLVEVAATSANAQYNLMFDYQYRCAEVETTACVVPPSEENATSFPDVPTDALCADGETCSKFAPMFFSVWMLSSASNSARLAGGGLAPSRSWTFDVDWVDADGGGTDPARLWLRKIGLVRSYFGASATLGDIRFDAPVVGALPNRVDYSDSGGVTENFYYRVGRIRDEFGGLTEVVYTQPRVCPQNVHDDPAFNDFSTNTWSCFPRYWSPEGGPAGFAVWHKYVVGSVIEHDVSSTAGISPSVVRTYSYPVDANNPGIPIGFENGGMAWHRDDERYVDGATLSWGEYRGFYEVRETLGTGPGATTRVFRYHRGMHEDPWTGGTKNVSVATSMPAGSGYESVTDWERFRGLMIEEFTASDPTAAPNQGADASGAVYQWLSTWVLDPESEYAWVELGDVYRRSDGQFSRTTNTYDADVTGGFYPATGRLTKSVDFGTTDSAYNNTNNANGDADDKCVTNTYAKTGVHFHWGLLAATTLHGNQDCSSAVNSHTEFWYGGTDDTAPPEDQQPDRDGRVMTLWRDTGSGVVDDAGLAISETTQRFTYEPMGFEATPGWGRIKTDVDARGHVTTYTYSSHSGEALIAPNVSHRIKELSVTNALGHETRTEWNEWGLRVGVLDANGRSVEACYDNQGRVTHILDIEDTKPGGSHNSAVDDCSDATTIHAYLSDVIVDPPAPGVVGDSVQRWSIRTDQKTHNQIRTRSVSLLDGLGRPAQTKSESPDAEGVVMTRTLFDDAGRNARVADPFYTSSAVLDDVPIQFANTNIPTDLGTSYESAGRVAAQTVYDNNTALRSATTTYSTPATVTTTPFVAAADTFGATRTNYDPYGRALSVTTDVSGIAATTSYRYNARDQIIEHHEPGLSSPTTMTYNTLGWRIGLDQRDAGVSATTYWATGQPQTVTDAEGDIIHHNIDDLGRTTATYIGTVDPANQLTARTWDPTGNIGAADATSSYQPAGTLAYQATNTDFNLSGRVENVQHDIPAADNPNTPNDDSLAGPINVSMTYTSTGLMDTQTLPGNPAWTLTTDETLTYTYGDIVGNKGLIKTVVGDNTYIADRTYDRLGRQDTTQLRAGTTGVDHTINYQPSDGRLSTINSTLVGGDNGGDVATNSTYLWDGPGNPTSIAHDPTGTAADELECFTYDTAQRLTRGYTSGTATCDGSVAAGGLAPYDHTYTHTDRNTLTTHTGRDYTYDTTSDPACVTGASPVKPNAVSAVSEGNNQPAETFTYNCNGALTNITTGEDPPPVYPGGQPAALATITPVRIYDSQVDDGGVKIPAGTNRLIASDAVPSNATAVAINIVAIQADAAGAAKAWQRDGTEPADAIVYTDTGAGAIAQYGSVTVDEGDFRVGVTATMHVIVDLVGYYTPTDEPVAAGRTIAIEPTRFIDSRDTNNPLTDNERRTLDITGVVPANAQAITGTITVVNHPNPGYVAVVPNTGTGEPPTSTVNYLTSETRSNRFVVNLDNEHNFDIFASTETDFIVDITGYITDASTAAGEDGLFVRLEQAELLASGTYPEDTTILGDVNALNDVADDAAAADFAFAVTQNTGSGAYVTVYSADLAQSIVSTANAPTNLTVIGATHSGLSTGGDVNIYIPFDQIVDSYVTGYYTTTLTPTNPAAAEDPTSTNYAWDDNNRLQTVTVDNNNPTSFIYNADGQRVVRTDPDGTTTIYLGPTDIRYNPTTTNIEVARYYPGGTQHQYNNDITHTTTNHQNSITTTINSTTTGTTNHTRYHPYGNPRTGPTPNDQGFLNQTHDNTTGLIYLNNRYHHPTLGSFISVDPLVTGTGEAYAYASANPIRGSDPLGLETCYVSGPNEGHCYSEADLASGGGSRGQSGQNPNEDFADSRSGVFTSCYSLCDSKLIQGGRIFPVADGYTVIDGIDDGFWDMVYDNYANPFIVGGGAQRAYDCLGHGSSASCVSDLVVGAAGLGAVRIAGSADNVRRGVRYGARPSAVANNLPEQLALDSARAGNGDIILRNLGDESRLVDVYGPGEWVKMQHVLRGQNQNVTVHWFRNRNTNQNVEYKFTSRYRDGPR